MQQVMKDSLKELDPNFVLGFTYTKDNLVRLLAEFSVRGLHVLTRPGHDSNTVYVFTRVDPTEDRLLDLYDITDDLNFVQSVTPLYDERTNRRLNTMFEKYSKKPFTVPTEKELVILTKLTGNPNIALYFSFLISYIRALFYLSIIGVAVRLTRKDKAWEFNKLYAVSVLLWSLYFTSNWIYNKKPHYVSKYYKTRELPIKNIQNKNNVNDVSSHASVLVKKSLFLPIVVAFVAALVGFQLICFGVEIFFSQLYSGPFVILMSLIPTFMISIFTPALTLIYNKVFVDKFVKFENGPAPSNSKMEKNFVLFFFVNYIPLFLTLLVYYPFGYKFSSRWDSSIKEKFSKYPAPLTDCDFVINTNRHTDQILYFTITSQIVLLLLDNVLPMVLSVIKGKIDGTEKPNSEQGIVFSKVKEKYTDELEFWKKVRDFQINRWGVFDLDDNLRKLVIQYGFVVMFSVVWPLTPLIYLIFNIVTLKADLWRVTKKCKPSSIPNNTVIVEEMDENIQKYSVIDSWDVVLQTMTWIGSIVSPLITLIYTMSNLPNIGKGTNILKQPNWYKTSPISQSWMKIILLTVLVEHLSIMAYFLISKIVIVLGEKKRRGKVPNIDTGLQETVDLLPIALETNRFMEENKSEIKKRNIKPIEIAGEPSIHDEMDIKDYSHNGTSKNYITYSTGAADLTSREENGTLSSPEKGHNTMLQQDCLVSDITQNNDQLDDQTGYPKRSDIAGATLPNQIPTSGNYHLRNNNQEYVENMTATEKVKSINENHFTIPSYQSGNNGYHEFHQNRLPSTLRDKEQDIPHRPEIIRSSSKTLPSHPDSIAAVAASTALNGEASNLGGLPPSKTFAKYTVKSEINQRPVLKDISNTTQKKYNLTENKDKLGTAAIINEKFLKTEGELKTEDKSRANDDPKMDMNGRRRSFLDKLKEKL